ncbi:hypothetical protein MAPG_10205 [Magnaporthiopsis poae ATCC 64411]|uniref:3'-5' exonuclease domain-containing protein n=1 Tax=Magnaporthiopsis poae (strain ATCC 64411 / 73-15) TaxID=644358 RepID=A0A0C4EBZ3_MAGP6|nr:hypothetical protein MAPG_10205 [Magnaporthiopsis poae ATCC 64411]
MRAALAKLPTVITSVKQLRDFLPSISHRGALYLDLEGKELGRNGTLDIVTVLCRGKKPSSLIDVRTLGDAAFTTPGKDAGRTLKEILEDPDVTKYFWDVRSDADALWSHHRVRLAGVTDVQLLENATRWGNKKRLAGLGTAVEQYLRLPQEVLSPWLQAKKDVKALLDADEDVFSRRPLTPRCVSYCAGDVRWLPTLRSIYTRRANSRLLEKVCAESARRVDEACGPDYQSVSEDKKFGPSWGSGPTEQVVA